MSPKHPVSYIDAALLHYAVDGRSQNAVSRAEPVPVGAAARICEQSQGRWDRWGAFEEGYIR